MLIYIFQVKLEGKKKGKGLVSRIGISYWIELEAPRTSSRGLDEIHVVGCTR